MMSYITRLTQSPAFKIFLTLSAIFNLGFVYGFIKSLRIPPDCPCDILQFAWSPVSCLRQWALLTQSNNFWYVKMCTICHEIYDSETCKWYLANAGFAVFTEYYTGMPIDMDISIKTYGLLLVVYGIVFAVGVYIFQSYRQFWCRLNFLWKANKNRRDYCAVASWVNAQSSLRRAISYLKDNYIVGPIRRKWGADAMDAGVGYIKEAVKLLEDDNLGSFLTMYSAKAPSDQLDITCFSAPESLVRSRFVGHETLKIMQVVNKVRHCVSAPCINSAVDAWNAEEKVQQWLLSQENVSKKHYQEEISSIEGYEGPPFIYT